MGRKTETISSDSLFLSTIIGAKYVLSFSVWSTYKITHPTDRYNIKTGLALDTPFDVKLRALLMVIPVIFVAM